MRIVISSGHSKNVRGASGVLDEVNEARKVTEQVAADLRHAGHHVVVFHDDRSTTRNENLQRIVKFHNSQTRSLDVSTHFNAFQKTSKAMGTEVLYVTQQTLAARASAAMAGAGGFINRGAKRRTDLYFLNKTAKPAVLLEVCFVDSSADAELYRKNFTPICRAIATALTSQAPAAAPKPELTEPEDNQLEMSPYQSNVKCSVFGGSKDPNKSAYKPFDVITDKEISCALPWKFPNLRPRVKIHNIANGREVVAQIRDIGPWLIDDDYWVTGARPLAETCHETKTQLPRGPHKGKVPNGAGLDVTPACAKALGIRGMGFVNWEFMYDDNQLVS